MIDPVVVNIVYAHDNSSPKTGTKVEVETQIEVHEAPIVEADIKYAECYPNKWVHNPQPCFKVSDIEKLIQDGIQPMKHEGFENNTLQNYAYMLGGLDFVLTLNAENGAWDHLKKSPVNGNGYRDVGLCQLNLARHAEFYSSDDFNNPYIQLRYCYDVYQKAIIDGRIKTTFYGYNVREKRNTKADGSSRIYEI